MIFQVIFGHNQNIRPEYVKISIWHQALNKRSAARLREMKNKIQQKNNDNVNKEIYELVDIKLKKTLKKGLTKKSTEGSLEKE